MQCVSKYLLKALPVLHSCRLLSLPLLCTHAGFSHLPVLLKKLHFFFSKHFLSSSPPDLTTLLISDLPPLPPAQYPGMTIYLFIYFCIFPTAPWLQMATVCFSIVFIYVYLREKMTKKSRETGAGTLLLPLGDSQLQRSVSSSLKNAVSSGMGRGSVSGLPVDTFKDFARISLHLKYF